MKNIKSIAPGKILISGEYSALFGSPVISLSVCKNIKTSIKFINSKSSIKLNVVILEIPSLSFKKKIPMLNLFQMVREIDIRYNQFKQNQISVHEILPNKLDLVKYILGFYLSKKTLNSDVLCIIESDLEMNLGLGSSASIIISLTLALVKLLKLNYSEKEIKNIAHNIENLQHGHSSGVDVLTSLKGGILKIYNTQVTKLKVEENFFEKFFIIKLAKKENTSNTVKYVINHFAEEKELWNDFAKISLEIEQNLINHDLAKIIQNIKVNNLLLKKISVVSKKNQEIISQIEYYGGAAKISGAGSLKNKLCGVIIAISNSEVLKKLAKKYNFKFESLRISFKGARYLP